MKGNAGIGCEIGYRNYKQDIAYTADLNDEIAQIRFTIRYKEFYFCPAVFETFTWKKYRISTSLSMPFQYITDQHDDFYREQRYKSANTAYFQEEDATNAPDRIVLGLFCNAGLQRKIYKNLYGGPQIGFGLYRIMARGRSHENIKVTENNVYNEFNYEVENEKYTDSRFDIRPTFSVSYYF